MARPSDAVGSYAWGSVCGLMMMLRTVACEPASWAAMLPQKFSVATTLRVPELAAGELAQADMRSARTPRMHAVVDRSNFHTSTDPAGNRSSIPVAHVTCATALRYNGRHAETESSARPRSRPRARWLATRVDHRGTAGTRPQRPGWRGLLDGLSRGVLPGGERPHSKGRRRRWPRSIRDRGPASRPRAVRALRADL